jgi:hypothetical protein
VGRTGDLSRNGLGFVCNPKLLKLSVSQFLKVKNDSYIIWVRIN